VKPGVTGTDGSRSHWSPPAPIRAARGLALHRAGNPIALGPVRLISRSSNPEQGGTQVPYVYVVQMDIPQHLEAEFNRIYDEDHVPTILKVPGVRSCTRYRLEHSTIPTMPRYLAVYEVDRAEIINSSAWQEASDLGEWKPKIRPHTTNRQHSVFRKIA